MHIISVEPSLDGREIAAAGTWAARRRGENQPQQKTCRKDRFVRQLKTSAVQSLNHQPHKSMHHTSPQHGSGTQSTRVCIPYKRVHQGAGNPGGENVNTARCESPRGCYFSACELVVGHFRRVAQARFKRLLTASSLGRSWSSWRP